MTKQGVSVIICCYNSAGRLPETLKHLAMQQIPAGLQWEVIVVDNASTDGTGKIAVKEWEKYTGCTAAFAVLSQPVPGKNLAFRTGTEFARYEFILTCDDDNRLSPGYVARAFELMAADPMIGALGGYGRFKPQYPLNEEIAPFAAMYVNGRQDWAATAHWVYGAGSTYRKSILTELYAKGWRQIAAGRKGKSLICGEDVEFCFMIYLSGYKIVADDRLLFDHFVPHHRQTISYITSLHFGLNYSNVLLNSYYTLLNKDQRPIEQVMNAWFKTTTKAFFKHLAAVIYRKGFKRQKRTIQQRINFSKIYGTWYALFKERKKIVSHHHEIKAILNVL